MEYTGAFPLMFFKSGVNFHRRVALFEKICNNSRLLVFEINLVAWHASFHNL